MLIQKPSPALRRFQLAAKSHFLLRVLRVLCFSRSSSFYLRANLRLLFLAPAPMLDCGQINLADPETPLRG